MKLLWAIATIALGLHIGEAAPALEFDLFSVTESQLKERLQKHVYPQIKKVDDYLKTIENEYKLHENNRKKTIASLENEVTGFKGSLKDFDAEMKKLPAVVGDKCKDKKTKADELWAPWKTNYEQQLNKETNDCLKDYASKQQKSDENYQTVTKNHNKHKIVIETLVDECVRKWNSKNSHIIVCVSNGLKQFVSGWKKFIAEDVEKWATSRSDVVKSLNEASKCIQKIISGDNVIEVAIDELKTCIQNEETNPSKPPTEEDEDSTGKGNETPTGDSDTDKNSEKTPDGSSKDNEKDKIPGSSDIDKDKDETSGGSDNDKNNEKTPDGSSKDNEKDKTPGASDNDKNNEKRPDGSSKDNEKDKTPGTSDIDKDKDETSGGSDNDKNNEKTPDSSSKDNNKDKTPGAGEIDNDKDKKSDINNKDEDKTSGSSDNDKDKTTNGDDEDDYLSDDFLKRFIY